MKVFLGGTCNGSNWRERLIPMLKIDYFNPVVDTWDESARQRELEERKDCDFCLYVFTPKMTGVYAVAEVVDDSNKRPAQTLMVLEKSDKGMEFTPAQWDSMLAVERLVNSNDAYAFDSLYSVVNFLNTQEGEN